MLRDIDGLTCGGTAAPPHRNIQMKANPAQEFLILLLRDHPDEFNWNDMFRANML